MNPKQSLKKEDIINLFSATHEYKVEQIGEEKFNIIYTGSTKPMDSIIYKPTLQTLLRLLAGIHYLEGREYKSKY